MKIDNDEIWNRIKSGELKGLSIEGYFVDKAEKLAKQERTYTQQEILEALNELINNK
jgi:hypothetical protein